jgi:hypothetical protein
MRNTTIGGTIIIKSKPLSRKFNNTNNGRSPGLSIVHLPPKSLIDYQLCGDGVV